MLRTYREIGRRVKTIMRRCFGLSDIGCARLCFSSFAADHCQGCVQGAWKSASSRPAASRKGWHGWHVCRSTCGPRLLELRIILQVLQVMERRRRSTAEKRAVMTHG